MKPKHPLQIEIEEKIRSQQKEQSTAEAYWGWVKRFLDYCKANRDWQGNKSRKGR